LKILLVSFLYLLQSQDYVSTILSYRPNLTLLIGLRSR